VGFAVGAPEQEVGALGGGSGCAGDVVVSPVLRDGVEAAEVEEKAVPVADVELVELGDVTLDEARADVRRLCLGPGSLDGAGHEVDGCHVPTVLGHVDRVRAGAAAEVESLAGRLSVGALHEVLELGRWNTGVPGCETEPIHGPKENAHVPATGILESEVCRAGVAHLAERNLPKVEVAGSSPVSRFHRRIGCTNATSQAGDGRR